MKKWLLVLGMVACMFGLTACGSGDDETVHIMTDKAAQEQADYIIGVLNTIDQKLESCETAEEAEQFKHDYFANLAQQMDYEDFSFMEGAIESWENAKEELGQYQETIGYTYKYDDGEVLILASIQGEKRAGTVEIVVNEDHYVTNFSSVTTNVNKSMGEKMGDAGLNTLLGMGTVFAVLILIAWVISLMKHIPKLMERKEKKNEARAANGQQAAVSAAVPAPAVEPVQEVSDDTELAAVIAAAIAASEGASSTDGFVVRSIRKTNKSKWQRA